MNREKGVILTISLIFIIILVIVAGIALIVQTNQARITEYQIRRLKAFYTAEAAIVRTVEQLRKGAVPPANLTLNSLTATIAVEGVGAGTGPGNTREITVSVSNY